MSFQWIRSVLRKVPAELMGPFVISKPLNENKGVNACQIIHKLSIIASTAYHVQQKRLMCIYSFQ